MKYEIDFINNPYFYCHRLICMLTGHELDDVRKAAGDYYKAYKDFNTRKFKDTIRKLGFMCNDRMIKFDKDTERPCLMRSLDMTDKQRRGWFASVYYDGIVYVPGFGKYTLEQYAKEWPEEKISSMLQVWLDIEEKINEKSLL